MADIIDMANDRAQAELDAAVAACVGNVSTAEAQFGARNATRRSQRNAAN